MGPEALFSCGANLGLQHIWRTEASEIVSGTAEAVLNAVLGRAMLCKVSGRIGM